MTGPDHYLAAEDALRIATNGGGGDLDDAARWYADAQVHATLALAAATALGRSISATPSRDYEKWMDVASLHRNLPT